MSKYDDGDDDLDPPGSEGDPNPTYEVGRGKPPVETRFPKGKSGNPRGRPKGSKNLHTIFEAEMKKQVTITEDGRRKKVSKLEAYIKWMVNKGLSGETKMIPHILKLLEGIQSQSPAPALNHPLDPGDQAGMDVLAERLRLMIRHKDEPADQEPVAQTDTSPPDEEGEAC